MPIGVPSRKSLPISRTPLIGRDTEIATVGALLARDDVALVTLTGPGGIGKTRLALAVAHKLADSYPDGAWFVSLAAVQDPTVVGTTIAHAFELADHGERPVKQTLTEYLSTRQLLLVIDNFEHIIAATPLVAELLDAIPTLTILVTSRSPLRLYAEHEYLVPPLVLPDPHHPPAIEQLQQIGAVQLFVERARNAADGFVLNSQNAATVAAICDQLTGMPLAIELAAARLKVLSLVELQQRLDQQLDLLTGGARDQPARLQTMRATIAWSIDLLDEPEQRIFRRCSVFAGGWTLKALRSVVEPELDALEGLSALVEDSLVQRSEQQDGVSRFTMLEPVRQYARELLEQHDEVAITQSRHAAYFCSLAAEAAPWVEVGEQAWLDLLDPERENLRITLARLSALKATKSCLRLVGDLRGFWFHRGSLSDAKTQLESVLALPDAEHPTTERAYALTAAGVVAIFSGEDARSIPLNSEALAIYQALDEPTHQPWLLIALGIASANMGEVERAIQYWEQSLELAIELGDQVNASRALVNLSDSLVDPEDADRRQSMGEEALMFAKAAGHPAPIHLCLSSLIKSAFDRGAYGQVAVRLQDTLALSVNSGWQWQLTEQLAAMAFLAHETGQSIAAAKFIGAHDALRDRTGMRLTPASLAEHNRLISNVSATISEDKFAAAWTTGQIMPQENVLTMAQEVLATITMSDPDLSALPSSAPYALSPRELDVLRLLAEGLSNREIGGQLYISHRTVMQHVASIMGKLDVTSRTAAAAWAIRHDLA